MDPQPRQEPTAQPGASGRSVRQRVKDAAAPWLSLRRRLPRAKTWLPLLAALLCFGALVYRTAWICDDAFISFRTVTNFTNGLGLRWNIAERVQTFTHPLWLLLLALLYGATDELFFTTLWLSLVLSFATVALLLWPGRGSRHDKILGVVLLCFSKAFVDFSSSGLENPLTHLLLVAFAIVLLAPERRSKQFLALATIAGLGALNRLDTILLYAPALLYGFPWSRIRRGVGQLVLGFLPLLLWESFALFYFGFPFPNTAYAKLNIGHLGRLARLLDGLTYLISSFRMDPITLATIAWAVVIALFRRDRRRLALLTGPVAYVAYVVWIGGDFMDGRFFAAPFVLAIACIMSGRWFRPKTHAIAIWPLTAALALAGKHPPPFAGADYGSKASKVPYWNEHGIHDERAMFFEINSLVNAGRMNPSMPDHPWAIGGRRLGKQRRRVFVVDAIGHAGFYAGPTAHILDRWALADALLARIPPNYGGAGHFTRVLPAGYLATLKAGTNQLDDPSLAQYYDRLRIVTTGPLWSGARLKEIWNFNVGEYDPLMESYAYARATSFEQDLRIVNPTQYPLVIVYVWHDGRAEKVLLDDASQHGSTYHVRWQITRGGVKLRSWYIRRLEAFSGELADEGTLSVAVLFRSKPEGSPEDIYDRRFAYYLQGDQLVVLRHPDTFWVKALPNGKWHNESISHVVQDWRRPPT